MDYMHFRFFSASMGRFQKPDSNFDNPTNNPQGWNLYSYVKGNPVNFNDPTGHQTTPGDPPTPAPYVAPNGPGPVAQEQERKREAERDRHIGVQGSKDDVQKLVNQIEAITGCKMKATSSDGKNWTVTATSRASDSGSATAKGDLMKALDAHTQVFMQGHTNGGNLRVDGGVSGGVGGNSMYLDPSDFKTQEYHGVSELAYSMGMTFFHEFAQTGAGGSLHDPGDKGLPTGVVTAVDHENQILSELGLPTRVGHKESSTGQHYNEGSFLHRTIRNEYIRTFSNGGSISTCYDTP
jgi:hypothetical protein